MALPQRSLVDAGSCIPLGLRRLESARPATDRNTDNLTCKARPEHPRTRRTTKGHSGHKCFLTSTETSQHIAAGNPVAPHMARAGACGSWGSNEWLPWFLCGPWAGVAPNTHAPNVTTGRQLPSAMHGTGHLWQSTVVEGTVPEASLEIMRMGGRAMRQTRQIGAIAPRLFWTRQAVWRGDPRASPLLAWWGRCNRCAALAFWPKAPPRAWAQGESRDPNIRTRGRSLATEGKKSCCKQQVPGASRTSACDGVTMRSAQRPLFYFAESANSMVASANPKAVPTTATFMPLPAIMRHWW